MKTVISIILALFLTGPLFSQSQEELLEDAYRGNSTALLERFFENWRKEKLPISDSEYSKLNDVQKDVYDLFYEFYNPLDMKHMKLEDWEYTMYENVKYVIIPDKIRYEFTRTLDPNEIFEDYIRKHFENDSLRMAEILNDSVYKKSFENDLFLWGELNNYDKDSIKEFHPGVKFADAKPLYLGEYYNNLLSEFLGSEYVPPGEYDVMQPAFSKGESEKKVKFLGNFIFVMISHWGDYWEILTSPKVSFILFDKNRANAIVYYSFPYHAGYSVFKKTDGKWIFVNDRFTFKW